MRRTWVFLALLLGLAPSARAAELHVGLIPEQNVFKQMERYRPLGAYLERKTGVTLRFRVLPRYGNILDSLAEGGMDGAFWGSFTGALALRKLGVEPLARPVNLDGTSTYHGHIFVRRDSGIRSVADMKGRTVVFVDKATTAGYVFPLAYFREQGIADYRTFFREHFFAGSHDAAIAAVLDGSADVGCAKDTIYDLVAQRDPRVSRDLEVLASSPVVPSNALGLRRGLPGELKQALKDALLEMSSDPEGRAVLAAFGAREFTETTAEDYRSVFELAERAGIDLATYQYRNE